jgi:hypothetical protein
MRDFLNPCFVVFSPGHCNSPELVMSLSIVGIVSTSGFPGHRYMVLWYRIFSITESVILGGELLIVKGIKAFGGNGVLKLEERLRVYL